VAKNQRNIENRTPQIRRQTNQNIFSRKTKRDALSFSTAPYVVNAVVSPPFRKMLVALPMPFDGLMVVIGQLPLRAAGLGYTLGH
jgi:hypothetical protein